MGELPSFLTSEVRREHDDDTGQVTVEFNGVTRDIRYLPNFVDFMSGYFRHELGLPPYQGYLGVYQQTVERESEKGLMDVMRHLAENNPELYEAWYEIYFAHEEEVSNNIQPSEEERIRRAILSSDTVDRLLELAQEYPQLDASSIFEH